MLRPAGAVRSRGPDAAVVAVVVSSPSGNFQITHAGRPAAIATMTAPRAVFIRIQFIFPTPLLAVGYRRRLTSCDDFRPPTWTSADGNLTAFLESRANVHTHLWARQGSNLRPPGCKPGALPLSYAPAAAPRTSSAPVSLPMRRQLAQFGEEAAVLLRVAGVRDASQHRPPHDPLAVDDESSPQCRALH